eukprot:scaffold687_cov44-Attheya_sp.AAC.1
MVRRRASTDGDVVGGHPQQLHQQQSGITMLSPLRVLEMTRRMNLPNQNGMLYANEVKRIEWEVARRAAIEAAARASSGKLLLSPMMSSPSASPSRRRTKSSTAAAASQSMSSGQQSVSSSSGGSTSSAHKAVHRGSVLGQSEHNERTSTRSGSSRRIHMMEPPPEIMPSFREYDLASIAEDDETGPHSALSNGGMDANNATKTKKRRRKRPHFWKKRPKIKLLSRKDSWKTEDDGTETVVTQARHATENAWMCGYCGHAFSSLLAAELHERKCVRAHVVVGQDGTPKTVDDTQQQQHERNKRPSMVRRVQTSIADFDPVPANRLPNRLRNRSMSADNMLVRSQKNNTATGLTRSELQLQQNRRDMMMGHQTHDAERELALLARDRAYYDLMAWRSNARVQSRCISGDRVQPRGILSKVTTKLSEAYELIKEGNDENTERDFFAESRRAAGEEGGHELLSHDDGTLYVNVVVKNSAKVVANELAKFAKNKWDRTATTESTQFERFRSMAHRHVLKVAGLALASDFTPRKIAVQLSNDLYRVLEPQLRLRGVAIQTEIEYRVGSFFVLSVNVTSIDWILLMEHTHNELALRKRRWEEHRRRKLTLLQNLSASMLLQKKEDDEDDDESRMKLLKHKINTLRSVTGDQAVQQMLAWLHKLHWIISVPFCTFWYYVCLRTTVRKYILASVTDDIFKYVEKKGMEMEIEIKEARLEAAFMLAALREMRAGDRISQKKKEEIEAGMEDTGGILGPLLGPAIPKDKHDAVEPDGFAPPPSLEYETLEMDFPVGFLRLRWAILHNPSKFRKDAVWLGAANFQNITQGEWSKYNDAIGLPELPEGITNNDIIGAEIQNRSVVLECSSH